jgi:hypothetical protein
MAGTRWHFVCINIGEHPDTKKNKTNMKIFNSGPTKIIKLEYPGEFSELRKLQKELDQLDQYYELILDLTNINYVTKEFTDMLIELKDNEPLLYERVKMLNPTPLVVKMLEARGVTQIYEVQNIYPTAW